MFDEGSKNITGIVVVEQTEVIDEGSDEDIKHEDEGDPTSELPRQSLSLTLIMIWWGRGTSMHWMGCSNMKSRKPSMISLVYQR